MLTKQRVDIITDSLLPEPCPSGPTLTGGKLQGEVRKDGDRPAGAAAFAAMTAYEHKRANEGDPVSHAHAKQALAALAGFEVGATLSQ